jgi:hypothetical protein
LHQTVCDLVSLVERFPCSGLSCGTHRLKPLPSASEQLGTCGCSPSNHHRPTGQRVGCDQSVPLRWSLSAWQLLQLERPLLTTIRRPLARQPPATATGNNFESASGAPELSLLVKLPDCSQLLCNTCISASFLVLQSPLALHTTHSGSDAPSSTPFDAPAPFSDLVHLGTFIQPPTAA